MKNADKLRATEVWLENEVAARGRREFLTRALAEVSAEIFVQETRADHPVNSKHFFVAGPEGKVFEVDATNSRGANKMEEKELTYGVTPNREPAYQGENSFFAKLISAYRSAAAPKIVAGPTLPSREGFPAPQRLADNPGLLAATAHVRLTGETMMGFYSRVGLGPFQIRLMTKSEISRFVDEVSTHEELVTAPRGNYVEILRRAPFVTV